MEFAPSEDQKAAADLAERLFAEHGSDERIRSLYESGDVFDAGLWEQLAQTGLLAMALPSAYGGSGFGMTELGLVLEQQGRFLGAAPLWRHALAASAIAEFGSDRLRGELLPGLVEGSRVASVATETGAIGALDAEAGENGWVLRGAAEAVALGPHVDVVVIPARTNAGMRLFAVPPRSNGIGLVEGIATNHERVANMEFDRVPLPPDAALAMQADPAWLQARVALCVAALQLGVLDEALRRASVYVGERHQFGRPIGSFQAVAVRMAEAYVQVELLRSAQWQLAWLLDAGRPAAAAALVAKFRASEAGHIVGHTVQHYHGGTGADLTYPIHRFFLWSRALELTGGGSEQALAALGEDLPATIGEA